MDYQPIINEIAELVGIAAPLGVLLGLSQWAVMFFLDAVFDRFSRRRTF